MTGPEIVAVVILVALCIGVFAFDAYDATRGMRR